MSPFYSWLLSVLGVVFLSVLVDVILPDGKTNKYVKAIFAFIIILIIISPLAKIKESKSFSDFLENPNITINEYISNINNMRIDRLVKSIVDTAEKMGLKGVNVQIVSDMSELDFNVQKVNIYLENLVIDESASHIDKYQTLVDIVSAYINISREDVVFYE